ncbi:hypothetical protein LF1_02820 [Rubripirellula obstinata]|uniref:Uncharacterized protein n=1 Tax=Rubripirellula obstinata TaxID=406547 RepID=A0A5B1CC45_9BACT|nr:hypothetical protein [Rubripirellula obstinata]KAA1257792.1 hypothetical protein LF1_02820 [Rubripirellula obstinata]
MTYDEPLVGTLAILMSLLAMAIAAGPWHVPYQLRTFAAICDRYGKPVARSIWLAIALAAFGSGLAILSGVRPGYADQQVPAKPTGK